MGKRKLVRLHVCAFTCIVIAGMVVSGCTRARSARPTLTHVKFLLDSKAAPTYAGFYIAKEKGIFADHSLDVEIVEGVDARTSTQTIGSGKEYAIGTCNGEATVLGRAQGNAIKSVAVFYPNISDALYSRGDAPIRRPTDMIGKKIGLLPDSLGTDEYIGVLAANHINRSRIHEVSVGPDSSPLLSKQVDGLIARVEGVPAELKAGGSDIVTMQLGDTGVTAYGLNVIVNESMLKSDAKTVQDFIDASVEGYTFVRDHPDDATAILVKALPQRNPEYLRQGTLLVQGLMGRMPVGSQTHFGWANTIVTLKNLGLLNKDVTVEDVVAKDYLRD